MNLIFFLPVGLKSNLLILTVSLLFFFLNQDDTTFISDTDDESSSWPNTGICDQTQILSSKESDLRRTVH